MKSFLLFVLFSGSVLVGAAKWNMVDSITDTEIEFIDAKWEMILRKAKEENKVVFVDVYAKWCGPCKLLKKTTFSDKEVGDFFNANFVNAAIDGETPEGEGVMNQYDIRSYPTMLFLNPDGTIRKVVVGYHNANQLLRVGKSVLN